MEQPGIGTMMLVPTLLDRGEEWMKEKWVESTVLGQTQWCQGYSEPGSGSDLASLKTRGELVGDEWVINGEKMWPSAAGVADVYCVVCTTGDRDGEDNLALIYVPKDVAGLSFGKPEGKMGMRVSDVNAAIYFDDVRVPQSYRAAGPGTDWRLFRGNISWGRLTSAPMAIGAAQAVLEEVLGREDAGRV